MPHRSSKRRGNRRETASAATSILSMPPSSQLVHSESVDVGDWYLVSEQLGMMKEYDLFLRFKVDYPQMCS